jgi:DNA-binding protein YbaB
MSDEQALGISDIILKPVLLKLIHNLEKKSVEGVSGNGEVRILLSGNVSVASVSINPQAAQNVTVLEQLVSEAANDAFLKARDMIRAEIRKTLGIIPWLDDLFDI